MEFFVIYRPIGTSDESASDEEQAEKILFAYPDEMDISDQLLRIMMLEGLIDFTSKFSSEDISTAQMNGKTWCFTQPEPGLWLICGSNRELWRNKLAEDVDSQSVPLSTHENSATANSNKKLRNYDTVYRESFISKTSKSKSITQADVEKLRPIHCSSSGLLDAISKLYRLYVSLFGEISTFLTSGSNFSRGSDTYGMKAIESVRTLRKKLRKTKQSLSLREHDLSIQAEMETALDTKTSSGDSELAGFHISSSELEVLIASLKEQIKSTERDLYIGLNPTPGTGEYTPNVIRRRLGEFMRWYISSGELQYPSVFHALSGMHFCTIGHPAFQGLTRVRQAVQSISRDMVKACVVIYDGQVAWSDLEDEATLTLYELLRLREHGALRDDLTEYARQVSGAEGGVDNAAVEDLRNKLHAKRNTCGFITSSWGVVDLEDAVFSADRGDSTPPVSNSDDTYFTMDNSANSYSKIWCPRFYAVTSKVNTTDANKDRSDLPNRVEDGSSPLPQGTCQVVGRYLVYRHATLLVTMILPDWDENCGEYSPYVGSNDLPKHEQNIRLLNFLAGLQRGLTTELDQLLCILDQMRVSSATNKKPMPASSRKQDAISSVESSSKVRSLSESVRVLYFNACNRTVKHSGLYNHAVDPAYLWPSPLRGLSDPKSFHLLALCADYRARFPVPAPLLGMNVEPAVLRAFNEASESMNPMMRSSNEVFSNSVPTEICIRLSTAQRGGKWMISRRLCDRYIFLSVEGCSTMNEMYEQVLLNAQSSFSRVVF